jgi:putative ABC transport system permease protein
VRVPPRFGRAFTDEEGEIGKNRVVILSDGLWRRRFDGDEAIGQSVRIDGEPYTVVGVMPAGFNFIDARVQAWIPLTFTDRQKTQRYSNS